MSTRRQFLHYAATIPVALAAGRSHAEATPRTRWPLCSNTYPWGTFAKRDGKSWSVFVPENLAELVQAGLRAVEPAFTKPEEVERLATIVKPAELAIPSLYVNSKLHESTDAESSLQNALAVAKAAKRAFGTTILVTNPSPIQWGGAAAKNDEQLREQARNLGKLGRALRELGMTLAYHNHDMELRQGAREFHHMLAGTDPADVKFCLDAHWVYRGCGNSQVALFDVVRLYGQRVVELHLRQSRNGVWTESFGPGDIDYPQLMAQLRAFGVDPFPVLEQAVEAESPKTQSAVPAHAAALPYFRSIWPG
jgi:inosose dehydratase